MFHASVVALEIIRSVKGLILAIETVDAGLGDQARRAARSISLNVDEGNRRQGRDKRYHWTIAAGSAAELRSALQQAEAWGYVSAAVIEPPLALIDRELAMLWRLTHPSGA